MEGSRVTGTGAAGDGRCHDRIPVIPHAVWPTWLGEDAAEPEQLKAVLATLPG